MKSAAILAGLACALAAGNAKAAAQVRFLGAFTVTSIDHCLARYVGETFNSAYRVASIGGNPAVTSLSMLNEYSGDVYELAGAPFPLNQWVSVTANGFDNVHYTYSARIRLTKQTPAVLNPATLSVALTGSIESMGGDPGVGGQKCVANFRGSYFKRVEFH